MARKRKLSKRELLTRNIARWEERQENAVIMLRRSAEELLKLRRQLRRLDEREGRKAPAGGLVSAMRSAAAALQPAAKAAATMETQCNSIAAAVAPAPADDWPSFCDRTKPNAADEAAKAEILAEQAAAKKARDAKNAERRKVKAEIRHAELTGQRRKPALEGKAALAAIRGE